MEKSQHKVPEEALKVSITSNRRITFLSMSAVSFFMHLFICAQLSPGLPFISVDCCLGSLWGHGSRSCVSRVRSEIHSWLETSRSDHSHILQCFLPFVQHEKYTSQLQLSLKALEARAREKLQFQSSEKTRGAVPNVKLQDRTERKAHSLTGNQPSEHTLTADGSRKTAWRRERRDRGSSVPKCDLSCRSLDK